MKLARFSSPAGEEAFGVYSDRRASDLSRSHSSFSDAVADLANLMARGGGRRPQEDPTEGCVVRVQAEGIGHIENGIA